MDNEMVARTLRKIAQEISEDRKVKAEIRRVEVSLKQCEAAIRKLESVYEQHEVAYDTDASLELEIVEGIQGNIEIAKEKLAELKA